MNVPLGTNALELKSSPLDPSIDLKLVTHQTYHTGRLDEIHHSMKARDQTIPRAPQRHR
jgi:hypothetical protein